MSKSNKKPIVKVKGHLKRLYWRMHRRINKIPKIVDDYYLEFKNPKEIINDYDYNDYTSICTEENCWCMKRFGRKKCLNK